MIKNYRKKPVQIQAIQFTNDSKDQCFNFVKCNKSCDFDEQSLPAMAIQTLEGVMQVSIGDYIIKGVNGEFYPCKPDIFLQTYDAL